MPTSYTDNRISQIIAQMRANGATDAQIQEWARQNGINLSLPIPMEGGGGGLLRGMFSGLRNRFGSDKTLFNGSLDLSGLKNLGSDIRATRLIEGGPTVGQSANAISGIYQGGKAIKGIYDNVNSETDLNDLKKDIRLQMATNPMYDMYMDANDEKLLRKAKNGTLTNNWGGAAEGVMQGLPQAGLSALMGGLTGGIPGALIGGIGSLVNSGIQGYGQGTQEAQSQLQGLYDRLRQANEEYRMMKRPSGLRRAGLSTQYFNQLY
jgi:hypothetical protein